MRALAIIALMSLAGCTTTQVLRSEPAMVLQSGQSMAALEMCIGRSMSMISNPSVLRGENETLITFGGMGSTAVAVTLKPTEPRTVEVRKTLGLNTKFRRRIRECAEGGSYKD